MIPFFSNRHLPNRGSSTFGIPVMLWKLRFIIAGVLSALLAACYFWTCSNEEPVISVRAVHNTSIEMSAEEIRSIRNIGEWEFLSIRNEELVEYPNNGAQGKKKLVRIYTGTLRLGVDLKKAGDDWLTSLPDSVAQLRLPRIQLLDDKFIDETRTQSFYQSSEVHPRVLDHLYQEAKLKMMRRCLTRQNLQQAEAHAREQFTRIFKAFGFKKVIIEFGPTPAAPAPKPAKSKPAAQALHQ